MVINPDGFDKNLWSVYAPGAKVSDLHALTGFSTFVESVGKKVIEVEAEDGKKYAFLPTQEIRVWRGEYIKEGDNIDDGTGKGTNLPIGDKKPLVIKGNEITPSDEFYSYW
jgi:hypothetical protein